MEAETAEVIRGSEQKTEDTMGRKWDTWNSSYEEAVVLNDGVVWGRTDH